MMSVNPDINVKEDVLKTRSNFNLISGIQSSGLLDTVSSIGSFLMQLTRVQSCSFLMFNHVEMIYLKVLLLEG